MPKINRKTKKATTEINLQEMCLSCGWKVEELFIVEGEDEEGDEDELDGCLVVGRSDQK